MAPKPRFTDGEKVLCFHGPLLYEAKCLRSQIREKHLKYFIHYSGWNKNWDEWVPECRVLKYNEANLQKQKELGKYHMKSKKSKSTKIAAKKDSDKEPDPLPIQDKTPKQKPSEKRAGPSPITIESSPEQSEPVDKDPEIEIEPIFEEEPPEEVDVIIDIPKSLQMWLVDDWDLVTRQKKLVHLPSRYTVDHIVASYIREKVSIKTLLPNVENTIVQVANRIRDCFNILLGKSLLYKFERPQYSEMLTEHSDLSMCQLYGGIHLLRMFTRIGSLLTSTCAPGTDLTKLKNHIEDFVRYMSENTQFFNLDDYEVASPEYHRRAL